jgi:hypothetical protein
VKPETGLRAREIPTVQYLADIHLSGG